ncbi:MAG: aldehyde dehydrogenase family protein, partial [Planctomycetota bacterium]|nr:aldehyde dehydrogenase family protein [Planctomycetota bacterium]
MIDLLKHPPSSYINGRFEPIPGDDLVSTDPTEPDRIIWQGSPSVDHVDEAIEQANATNYGLAASIFTNDDAAY